MRVSFIAAALEAPCCDDNVIAACDAVRYGDGVHWYALVPSLGRPMCSCSFKQKLKADRQQFEDKREERKRPV